MDIRIIIFINKNQKILNSILVIFIPFIWGLVVSVMIKSRKEGFVDHKAYGKTHEYFPLVTKEKYTRFYLNNMIRGYFNGSFQNLVSFFARDNKLDAADIEKLLSEAKSADIKGVETKTINTKNKKK